MAIDIERCRRGQQQLLVYGTPTRSVVRKVTELIDLDASEALTDCGIILNSAGIVLPVPRDRFRIGDDGIPMCKHGVFGVLRTAGASHHRCALDKDAVYFLDACLAFCERGVGSDLWDHVWCLGDGRIINLPFALGLIQSAKDASVHMETADVPEADLTLVAAVKRYQSVFAQVLRVAPGYDWNADPHSLTRLIGEAHQAADAALKAHQVRDGVA